MAIGDAFTLKVIYQNTITGVFIENQLHYQQLTTPPATTPEEDLVDQFQGGAEATLTNLFHLNYSIVQYQVITRPGTVVTFDRSIATATGGQSGDQLPPNLAAIVSLKTTRFDGSGRGRFFLPPANEASNNAAGQLTGTYIGAILSWMPAAIQLDFIGAAAQFTMGVWSEKEQEFNPLSSHTVRNYWGSQRGRRF